MNNSNHSSRKCFFSLLFVIICTFNLFSQADVSDTSNSTGVNKRIDDKHVEVYLNSTEDTLFHGGHKSYFIYDEQEVLLIAREVESLDVRNLQMGVFTIETFSEGKKKVRKFEKEVLEGNVEPKSLNKNVVYVKTFGVHGGINTGILAGGTGPSFSFHSAIRTNKVVQFESMLFFDYHSGRTFLSGYSQVNLGVGFMGGIRINALPKRNWNPSLVIMAGMMYGSETIDDTRERGFGAGYSLALSNTFYQKHTASFGVTEGKNISSFFLKYGRRFSRKKKE